MISTEGDVLPFDTGGMCKFCGKVRHIVMDSESLKVQIEWCSNCGSLYQWEDGTWIFEQVPRYVADGRFIDSMLK